MKKFKKGEAASAVVVGVAVLLGVFSRTSIGAEGFADPNHADTSRSARESAVQTIPFERLDTDARNKVNWVLANTSVFRRMPARVVQSDPDLYLFLVRHPDVVVNVWEVLGMSRLSVRQAGPDLYQVSDDAGTTGSLEFLYRGADTHVAYVEGIYKGGTLTRQIHGRGLMVLKSGYMRQEDGRYYVTSRLDAFLNVEPGGVEFLTKTFQPMVGKVADLNFTQAVGFLGSMSRTAEVNNRGMQRLAKRLVRVQPDVRDQFAALANQVSQRAAQWTAAEELSNDKVHDSREIPLMAQRVEPASLSAVKSPREE